MRSNNYLYPVSFSDEITEIAYVWTWGVADNQSGGKVDNLNPILLHLLWSVFNVSTRVTATSGVST